VLADKRHHVSRTSYPTEAGIEDEFRHSRGCLELGPENIRLQRVEETLLAPDLFLSFYVNQNV
jgi:hypothetical protein